MSLLDLLVKDPDGVLASKTLRTPASMSTLQPKMGGSGLVAFDLVENGTYADFVPQKGGANVCSWTVYENYDDAPLEGAKFVLTAPLTGCTAGVLKSGHSFRQIPEPRPGTGIDLNAARQDRLNFVFGPPEYDTVSRVHSKRLGRDGIIQVLLFGVKMGDGMYTFWAQWQWWLGKQDEAERITWAKVGRYPNA